MKKILIIYASAGDGHKKAAEAVYEAFVALKRDDISAVLIDSLNYTNRLFKYLYKVGYIFLIRYIPNLWGFFYHMLDNKIPFLLNKPFRRLNNALNAKRLEQFLIDEQFDIAISTHFLGTEVISHLKNKGLLRLTLINIITDFKPHRFWQARDIDHYVVASEKTKSMLAERGVAEEKISPLGIPIHRKFGIFLPKEEMRKRLKLYPNKTTILVMGGGFGVGPIEAITTELQKLDLDCQIVVVCGHNRRLFNRLNILKERFKRPTSILGFCRNIDEIMAAGDLMVSKVGGITMAEALSRTLPTLVINPIPGQEMRNAEFLFENNAGLRVRRVSDINGIAQEFLTDTPKAREIRHNMDLLARPNAAEEIARLAISLL